MQRLISAAVLTGALALAVPAVAGAASVAWVSGHNTVGNNKSCSAPGYNTVQAAIDAVPSGATIHVCGGTYTEQIEITKPVKLLQVVGSGTSTLALPSAPSPSKTSCDTAPGLEPGQIDEVSVCTSGKVDLSNLTIEALAPITTCAGGLYGIFVGGGATLNAIQDDVVGASTTLDEYKGCQHGVAVEVGSAKASEVGHAKFVQGTISGYEKNGPTAAFTGSTLKLTEVNVEGEAASPYIAKNGVEIAYGAKGLIRDSSVRGNECELAGVCSASALEEQATGVLFYGAAKGSSVIGTEIALNDIGVYYASTSATQPTSPEVKVKEDKFASNRYEGIVLEQGDAKLLDDEIEGAGNVGIDIVQSASQPYANDSSASGMTIEGQSEAAVGVVTDNAPGDPSGHFTIKDSSISKNAAQVLDPSSTFTVESEGNS
jgi:hypothetical protein